MAAEKEKAERSVTLWQPFREMEELGRRFEDFFGRPFSTSVMAAGWRRWMVAGN